MEKDMVEYESEKKNIHIIQFIVLKFETIDGYETTYSVEKMKDEDVYPFDENGHW